MSDSKHPAVAGRDGIDALLEVMRRLRDPQSGCPWDIEQDFASVAPYTVEEAYEVADAIARADMGELRDELGDLLLQVVFHAQMAAESGTFDFGAVVDAIVDKMIRRHPHVFGDTTIGDAAEQTRAWEAIKAVERGSRAGAMDGVTRGLPPLVRAEKLQRRAARVGFDWPDATPVFDKVAEELEELRGALDGGDAQAVEHELGDLLFSCVNLARHAGFDAEQALLKANLRFERRFREMERVGGALGDATPDQLEALWARAKAGEG